MSYLFDQLSQLVSSTNPRVLGQVLKSKKHTDLYVWLIAESAALPPSASTRERAIYILMGKPNLVCNHGCTKKFNGTEYKFCGNITACQCFRELSSAQGKLRDMRSVTRKRTLTWIKRYGVDNPSKNSLVAQKIKNTKKSRNYHDLHQRLKTAKILTGYWQVIDRVKPYATPKFKPSEYIGCHRHNQYPWMCVHCGNSFLSHVDYGTVPKCPGCYPAAISAAETALKDWIGSLGISFTHNDRSLLGDLELDIYIPSKSLAIEYNGIYWHSAKFKHPTYHVDKMLKCNAHGVRLIQIFEDEWETGQDIVKNRLLNCLGLSECVGARECQVRELTVTEYQGFSKQYCSRANPVSEIRLGLENAVSGLVAVMGFCKIAQSDTDYELINFCSKNTVIGGFGKLFSQFVKTANPTIVIAHADRCWGQGTVYEKLGFTDVTDDGQNFETWHICDNVRYRPENTPDAERFHIIHDCGSRKFLWTSQV